jgi:hypothetical protein
LHPSLAVFLDDRIHLQRVQAAIIIQGEGDQPTRSLLSPTLEETLRCPRSFSRSASVFAD